MNPPPIDPLQELLDHPPHLEDAGFTDGVLSALPRLPRARAVALTLGGLASAIAGALVVAGALPEVAALATGRVGSPSQVLCALLALATPLATLALAIGREATEPAP